MAEKQIGMIVGTAQQDFIEEMQRAINQGWTLLHCYAVVVTLLDKTGSKGVRHYAIIERDKPN